MMTRRTGLMAAFFATAGQSIRLTPAQTYRVYLSSDNGIDKFEFTDGTDTVTFTAKELMAALKESR